MPQMGIFSDARRLSGGVSFVATQVATIDQPIEPLFGEIERGSSESGPSVSGLPSPSPVELISELAALGIDVGHLAAARRQELRWIIVNGLETAPYATARSRALVEHAQTVIDTAAYLGEVLDAAAVQVVVDAARRDVVRELRRRMRGTAVVLTEAENIYPQDHPRLLFRLVTTRALPPASSPAEQGAWIVDVEAMLDLYRALALRQPPVVQALTVSGDAVQRPGNYLMPLGTTVGTVLERLGLHQPPARVVMGSALVGAEARTMDTAIPSGAGGLYAWTRRAVPDREPTGCVRCGQCIEVCPVRIEPINIYSAMEAGRPERAARLVPQACIDCGLCDFVCPSYLPLMNSIREARAMIAEPPPMHVGADAR